MSQSSRANGSASFRDPSGRLLLFQDRAVRLVNGKGAKDLRGFLSTNAARQMVAAQQLVDTNFIDPAVARSSFSYGHLNALEAADEASVVVEHERVAVRSFPYEWPPQMLHAAGALMLDLAESALAEGFSLKDATPYNVLFRGTGPVFVDLLSFEPRDAHDPTWLPLNQFVRTILLPLLANKYFGLRLDQLLMVHRDGLEPKDIAPLCGPVQRLTPLFLSLIFLPHWLGEKQGKEIESIYQPQRLGNPQRAEFVLRQQFKRLRKQLTRLEPASGDSDWSRYMTTNRSFSAEYLKVKEAFVAEALKTTKPRRVLDVGCNTGHFSRLAAKRGASVVAIDQDPVVAGAVWKNAVAEDLDILPLVVNLARPTPALGWRNEECPSFLDRARGNFDLVMMLAVLHHILVTEQIPLPAIMELAAEITSNYLIIEFIAPEDPMFHRLVRGREKLFYGLTRDSFEATAQRWFQIVRSQRLHGTRWLYLMQKRSAIRDA